MRVYLNIGSNLGDKKRNIEEAISLIESACKLEAIRSNYIESEPWGYDSDNNFLNIGILIDTAIDPHMLLAIIHDIEKKCGSVSHRKSDGSYADRIIDIDIMDIDEVVINSSTLIIPHPHLNDRDFFRIPYQELKSYLDSESD